MSSITARFRGVENSPPPSDEQAADVAAIRAAVSTLAEIIDNVAAHPRYKATALTHLETAAMFAVKGVFAPLST